MMQPILESLALHLLQTGGGDPGETRVILPNRRAGLFLQQHLARHSSQVRWVPRISAVNDFISEFSLLESCDPVRLLFMLYDIYSSGEQNPDPFDVFYFWGEIMLRDFDELDKYRVDARMLFSNIIDLKQLEEPTAGLEPGQMQFIRQFWEGFHDGSRTAEKDKFLESWERLPVLYHRLREDLFSRGEGYQGMQYREMAERIERGEVEYTGQRTVVAGFNALNSCEKQLFSWLQQHGAEFFWDHSDADRFMRENLKLFPQRIDLEPERGPGHQKEIRIFELPTDVLQAKTAHRILEQCAPERKDDCTDTALVLCDEELLMPVIMSLPESVNEINITMGYPMKNTPAYGFLDSLIRLQHNIRLKSGEEPQFYHRDVTAILLHPYMRHQEDVPSKELLERITGGNLVMVESSLFTGSLEKKIFRSAGESMAMLDYFRDIFLHILENLSSLTGITGRELDLEFIFQLLIQLNKLEWILPSGPAISGQVLVRLLQRMLQALRVPFEGEPLSGLQVMGILETRLLDFRHVIFLSMNEEVMPVSHHTQSYIPYSMRLAFGMPSREDKDAIYAYYFDRLLRRAEKVDLLYNSASEGVRTGEMSRYLYQLKYEGKPDFYRPGMEVKAIKDHPLTIEHGPEVERKLQKYTRKGEGEKYLSPSAINAYIDCSLRFCLRYLEGIGEPDEVREEIDAAGFGTVVHESIRLLYSEIADRTGGTIIPEALKAMVGSDHTENVLKQVFSAHHFKGRKRATLEGRNIIIFRVMLRYLEKILQVDSSVAPFQLVSLEASYFRKLKIINGGSGREVRLGGKIDRIDRVNGILRVIDYKTGDARQGFSSLDSLFDPDLSSRNGAALQTLFYAWLVGEQYPGVDIMPGLYVMKALYGEAFDPALTIGTHSQRRTVGSFSELEDDYITLLKDVLGKIFDPEIPFTRTEHISRCRHCDFAAICNRKTID